MDIEPIVRKNLTEIVEEYQRITDKPLSAISRKFYGNSDFLDQFLYGQKLKANQKRPSIALNSLDLFLKKMRAAWPDGANWPMTKAVFMDLQPSG